ncbi:MAG TPA: LysR family transcriptional regulator [Ramlibacter sp.]|nr:LysR family transcriptional regulator [Ramlibacter sp.]
MQRWRLGGLVLVKRQQRIDLDSLRLLQAVEQHGSFAAAAQALCVVTSTITHAVRGLEERVGLQIFDRSGRRVRFTANGRALLEHGRTLLAQADAFDDRMRTLATGWEPRLVVAVDEVIPMSPVMALVRDFLAAAPHTTLRLCREAAAGSWDALVAGRADLVVGAPARAQPAGGGCDSVPFVPIRFVLAVAAGHPLAGRNDLISNAEIARHRSVVLDDTTRALPHLPYGLQDHALQLAVPDEASKLEAIRLGLGCGFLPEAVARPRVRRGELRLLKVQTPHPPSDSAIAWRAGEAGRAVQWWVQRLSAAAFHRRLFR